jgi:hypothetical protein
MPLELDVVELIGVLLVLPQAATSLWRDLAELASLNIL